LAQVPEVLAAEIKACVVELAGQPAASRWLVLGQPLLIGLHSDRALAVAAEHDNRVHTELGAVLAVSDAGEWIVTVVDQDRAGRDLIVAQPVADPHGGQWRVLVSHQSSPLICMT